MRVAEIFISPPFHRKQFYFNVIEELKRQDGYCTVVDNGNML
jgi:hypothetical protein